MCRGSNVTLSRWRVNECGAGGVSLSGGDREHLEPCHHRLVDSELSRTDQVRYYAFPIIRSKQIQNGPKFPMKMDLFCGMDLRSIRTMISTKTATHKR